MAPPGAELTLDQLLTALKWKLENGDISDSQKKNWAYTWSQRILESKHVTHLLKQGLNTTSAVNYLPREILGEIFHCLQREYSNTSFQLPQEPRGESDLGGANLWIKLTHVCRYWRHCAHNTKALWRQITLSNTLESPGSLAIHFFTLSHPLPITLEQEFAPLFDSEEEQMNRFYTLLIDFPDRISALYLRGDFPDMAWGIIQMSMPNIVEVELAFDEPARDLDLVDHYWDKSHLGRNGDIPNFLGKCTSPLRKLALTNYAWPRETFPPLTHLYLTSEFYDPEDQDVGESFLEVLSSLSFSLQVLYLQETRTLLPESYTVLPISARPVMGALRHLELLQSPTADETCSSLMLLYNISLPAIETLIWDALWSEEIYRHTPDWSSVPPVEHLERVSSLVVGWAPRGDEWPVYVLSLETLYFGPGVVTYPGLNIWQTLLPKVVTLALNWDDLSYKDDIRGLLKGFTLLQSLHFCGYGRASLLLSDLEKEEDGSNADFLPHLKTLTIYTGSRDIKLPKTRRWASEQLLRRGLEPLELATDNSMYRARRHLKISYILRYEMGSINGLFIDKISS